MDQNQNDSENNNIEAWKRVHAKLTLALIQSRDNISSELTKRRYILEEMNRCKMQNSTSHHHKSAPGHGGSVVSGSSGGGTGGTGGIGVGGSGSGNHGGGSGSNIKAKYKKFSPKNKTLSKKEKPFSSSVGSSKLIKKIPPPTKKMSNNVTRINVPSKLPTNNRPPKSHNQAQQLSKVVQRLGGRNNHEGMMLNNLASNDVALPPLIMGEIGGMEGSSSGGGCSSLPRSDNIQSLMMKNNNNDNSNMREENNSTNDDGDVGNEMLSHLSPHQQQQLQHQQQQQQQFTGMTTHHHHHHPTVNQIYYNPPSSASTSSVAAPSSSASAAAAAAVAVGSYVGAYGNGIGMATPAQMELAFQMMQQMNRNAAAEEEEYGGGDLGGGE